MKLLTALGLVILSAFATQPPINGKLVALGQDSISVEVNQQITTVHIAPDTEIWRRGIDLTDLHELILGDEIGVTYRRAAADGSPIPTLIVAFEEGDIVDPVLHHVGEYRVCAGLLSKVAGDRICDHHLGGAVVSTPVDSPTTDTGPKRRFGRSSCLVDKCSGLNIYRLM